MLTTKEMKNFIKYTLNAVGLRMDNRQQIYTVRKRMI